MRNFIKIHWFGILLSIPTALFFSGLALVFYSPRQDTLNRGFIPCTQKMVKEVFECNEQKHWCMSKAIIKNTACDFTVIFNGLSAWVAGKQPTPWSNYFFEPVLPTEQSDDDLKQDFYTENPRSAEDMAKLKQDWDNLEKTLNNPAGDADSKTADKEATKQDINQHIQDVVKEKVNDK